MRELEGELQELGLLLTIRYGYETGAKREKFAIFKSHNYDAAALGIFCAGVDNSPAVKNAYPAWSRSYCFASPYAMRERRASMYSYLPFSRFFPSMYTVYAFFTIYCLWCVSEITIALLSRRHKDGVVKKGDRGSCFVIIISIFASIFLSCLIRFAGLGVLPAAFVYPGLLLMLLGMALRVWAVFLLGGFFSMEVELKSGHRLITSGPYRYIRHPAYAGSLITLTGLAVALTSWLSAAATLVIFLTVYSFRIRVEEEFLLASLGEEYREYMRRTGRFFPRLAAAARREEG